MGMAIGLTDKVCDPQFLCPLFPLFPLSPVPLRPEARDYSLAWEKDGIQRDG